MAIDLGRISRGRVKSEFGRFASNLRNAETGSLVEPWSCTANDLRNAFRRGGDHARRVAGKNAVKETAYGTAYDSVLSLRQDLTSLAEDGDKEIKQIQDSEAPTELKVTHILELMNRY